jgi:hypothetical protein
MKPILISTMTLILMSSIYSCKKDNGASSLAGMRPKTYTENIKSVNIGNSITTYDLTYDGNGRVISFASESPGGIKTLYQYNSNNTYTLDLYEGNILDIHELFFINSQSLVDSTFQYNTTNDTTTEKYHYNQAGQLLTMYEYDYSTSGTTLSNTSTYSYDNNGNAISLTDDLSVTTYTYYSDLLNPLNLGSIYFPVSKYLLKTTTNTSSGGTISATHVYGFDSSKRLTTDSAVVSTGDVIVKTYTY